MKIGLIKPNYPDEKRVALLPEDINDFENELIVESGYGEYLDVSDDDYIARGCKIKTREEIYCECDTIFNLKLTQPSDYEYLRENQMIIGWTHPTGSGVDFMKKQAIPKKLVIVDLDNIFPYIFTAVDKIPIDFLKPNFIWKNSFMAGYSSTVHALVAHGMIPDSNTKVAVLSSGNVAQGAYNAIAGYNCDVRMFYRKTMSEFYDSITDYDIIINGIEIDSDNDHIITKDQLARLKKGTFIIDAAADAGRAVEGTHYTSISNPVYKENGLYFYEVNNSPSIFYRKSSRIISKVMSDIVFSKDVKRYWDLVK